MMKRIIQHTLAVFFLTFSYHIAYTQVAINENGNAPDSSAMLDISSSDKGLLIPSMTEEARDLIKKPAEGLMIYNTTDSCFNYYTGTAWYKDCGRDLESDKMDLSFIAGDLPNPEDITIDSEGNILYAGRFTNSVTFGDTTLTSAGSSDAYVVKYDADNNILWAVGIGESYTQFDPHIAVDSENNVYLTALFRNSITIDQTTITASGTDDIFLAKFNSLGVFQWIIQTDFNAAASPSGDLEVDENDNVYVSGWFEGSGTFGSTTITNINTQKDGFLAKCDSDGNWQWAAQIASDNEAQVDAMAIKGDTVYVAGNMEGNITIGTDSYTDTYEDVFVAKYSTDGDFSWSGTITSEDDIQGYALGVDDVGNFYVGGYMLYAEVNFEDTIITIENEGFYLAKFNANNEVQWISYQDDEISEINDLTIDKDNNIIVVGEYRGTMTFETTTVTAGNSKDETFIIKFDTDGNMLWVEVGASYDNLSDSGLSIVINNNINTVYVMGEYNGTVIFTDVVLEEGTYGGYLLQVNNEDGSQSYITNSLANSQDGDTDATNELQDLSLNGTSLSISNGASVELSDNDATNELQDLFLNGTTLSISDGNEVTLSLSTSNIQDTDGDTQIQVEEGNDDDIIRFDLGGTEFIRLDNGRIEILNTGNSVFLGEGAGANDDFTNSNVFIGSRAGNANTEGYNSVAIGNSAAQNVTTAFENVSLGFAATRNMTTGSDNVAIGFAALENNEEGGANTAIGSGAGKGENLHSKSKNVLIGYNAGTKLEASNNTMLGYEAGLNTVSGTDNVFLGYQAGYNEIGSNKLYISNSNTSTPLLYGDFSTNFLQINGTLNINDAFTLPSTDGDSSQVLTTDGSGIVAWVDAQGDHLGDHIATQNLQLTDSWLSNDGDNEGISINNDGQVGIGNLNIGSESNDQGTSNQSGNGFATTPWLYTNAVEAQDERGGSSTLITVGNDGTYGNSDEIHLVTNGESHLNLNSSGEVALTSGELMTYSSNGSSQVELTDNGNNSGQIKLYDSSSQDKVNIFVNGSDNVGAAIFSGVSSSNILLGFLTNYPDHGFLSVRDASSNNQAGIYVDASGDGIVFGDTKNFRMDHPKDKSKEIWYASLEGPEAAAYMRGTGTLKNGVAVIEFPEHFVLVANPETMTIQLTPNSIESRGLAVTSKNGKGFTVGELMQGKGTYTFDWTATAVRKGYEKYEPVREKVDFSMEK